jgi:pimeloyl-ACP methyl ester carboxylesterase
VRRWLEIAERSGEHSARRQRTHLQITLQMLDKLSVRTLLLAGDQDPLAPPELMQLLHSHLPQSSLIVLPQAGHALQWEYPDEWNRLVLDFLTSA